MPDEGEGGGDGGVHKEGEDAEPDEHGHHDGVPEGLGRVGGGGAAAAAAAGVDVGGAVGLVDGGAAVAEPGGVREVGVVGGSFQHLCSG